MINTGFQNPFTSMSGSSTEYGLSSTPQGVSGLRLQNPAASASGGFRTPPSNAVGAPQTSFTPRTPGSNIDPLGMSSNQPVGAGTAFTTNLDNRLGALRERIDELKKERPQRVSKNQASRSGGIGGAAPAGFDAFANRRSAFNSPVGAGDSLLRASNPAPLRQNQGIYENPVLKMNFIQRAKRIL